MQNILILIIVAICAFFIGRRFYRNLRNQGGECGCSSGCTSCGPGDSTSCTISDKE